MKKIQYTGNRRKGTLNPRHVWSPQETRQLPDQIADKLLQDPEFREIKPRRRKKRPTQHQQKSDK